MGTNRPRNEYEEWKKRKKLADRNLLSKKETAILNKSHFKTNSGAYPRGSSKAFNTRNTVDILLLRQLGARMPGFQTCENAPNLETKYAYGLKNFHTGEEKVLSETEQMKKRPWVDRNHEIQNLQNIYTDGSYLKTQELAGYSVFWGEGHKFNSYGLVPLSGPPSSTSAEEYAILLALLLVKWDNRRDVQYVVRTDARWVKDDILQWVAKWGKHDTKIGWKKRAANPTTDMLKLNAGILWDLRFRGLDVIIQHVPGHRGVSGNEEADEMAKRATHHHENFGFYPVVLPPQTSSPATKDSDLPTPAMECQEFIDSRRPSSKGLDSIIDWGAVAKMKSRHDQGPAPSQQLATPTDFLESDIPHLYPYNASLGHASPEMINLVSDTGTSGNSSPDGWDSEGDQYDNWKAHGTLSPGEPYRLRESSPIRSPQHAASSSLGTSSHAVKTSRFTDTRNSVKFGEQQPLPRKRESVSNSVPAKPRTSKVRFAEPTVSSYREQADSPMGSDFIDLCEDEVHQTVKQPTQSKSASSSTTTNQDSSNGPRIPELSMQRSAKNPGPDTPYLPKVEPNVETNVEPRMNSNVEPNVNSNVESHVEQFEPVVETRPTAEGITSNKRFSLPPSIAAGFRFFDESGFPTLPQSDTHKRRESTNDRPSKSHTDREHEHAGSRSSLDPHGQLFVDEPASDSAALASNKRLPESLTKAVLNPKRNSLPLSVYESYNSPSSFGKSLESPLPAPVHLNPPAATTQPVRARDTKSAHRQVPSIDVPKRAPERGAPGKRAPEQRAPGQRVPSVTNKGKVPHVSPVSPFPTLQPPPPIPSPISPFSAVPLSSEAMSLPAPSSVTPSASDVSPKSTAPSAFTAAPTPPVAAPPASSALPVPSAPPVPSALPVPPVPSAASESKPSKYPTPAPPLVSPTKIIPQKTSQARARASLLKPSTSKHNSNSPPVDVKPKLEPSKIDFSKLKILKRATLEAKKQEELQKRLDASKMDVDEDVNTGNVNVDKQNSSNPAGERAVRVDTPLQQPTEDVKPSLSTPSPELRDGGKESSAKPSKRKSSTMKNALKKAQPTLMFSNLLNQIGSRKSSKDSTSSGNNSRQNSDSKASTESAIPGADPRDSLKDTNEPEEKLLPAIDLSVKPPKPGSNCILSTKGSNNGSRLSSSAIPGSGNLPVQDNLDDLEFDEEIDKQIRDDIRKPSIDTVDMMGSAAIASNYTDTDAIGIPVSVEQPPVSTQPLSPSRSDKRPKSPEMPKKARFNDSRLGSTSPVQSQGSGWTSKSHLPRKPSYSATHSHIDGPNRADSRVSKRRSLSKPISPIINGRNVFDKRHSLPVSALDYGPSQSPGLVSPKDTSQPIELRHSKPQFNVAPLFQTLEPAPFDEDNWKTKDISPVNLGKFSLNPKPQGSPTRRSTALGGGTEFAAP